MLQEFHASLIFSSIQPDDTLMPTMALTLPILLVHAHWLLLIKTLLLVISLGLKLGLSSKLPTNAQCAIPLSTTTLTTFSVFPWLKQVGSLNTTQQGSNHF